MQSCSLQGKRTPGNGSEYKCSECDCVINVIVAQVPGLALLYYRFSHLSNSPSLSTLLRLNQVFWSSKIASGLIGRNAKKQWGHYCLPSVDVAASWNSILIGVVLSLVSKRYHPWFNKIISLLSGYFRRGDCPTWNWKNEDPQSEQRQESPWFCRQQRSQLNRNWSWR